MPLSKPALALPLIVLFVVVFTFRSHWAANDGLTTQPSPIEESSDVHQSQLWEFDHRRDANDYGLSESACISAFPRLYEEIDRSVAYWKKRGGIKPRDIDLEVVEYGGIRAKIQDNKVLFENVVVPI